MSMSSSPSSVMTTQSRRARSILVRRGLALAGDPRSELSAAPRSPLEHRLHCRELGARERIRHGRRGIHGRPDASEPTSRPTMRRVQVSDPG